MFNRLFSNFNPDAKYHIPGKAGICLVKEMKCELNAVNATFYREIGKNEIFLHSLS